MQKLVEGLHRFQANVFGSKRELFERLAKKQSPETLFITCSDSRITPSLLTQTGPGDLFILRNAGNLVPPYGPQNGAEAAAIEYAVAGLGVKDIIICGHSSCGAMGALLDPASIESMPAVGAWLQYGAATRRIIDENYNHLEGEARLTATVEENVLVQLEHLRTHPSVAAALARGDLHIYGWVYKIGTGEVFGYDADEHAFKTLATTTPLSNEERRRAVTI